MLLLSTPLGDDHLVVGFLTWTNVVLGGLMEDVRPSASTDKKVYYVMLCIIEWTSVMQSLDHVLQDYVLSNLIEFDYHLY